MSAYDDHIKEWMDKADHDLGSEIESKNSHHDK